MHEPETKTHQKTESNLKSKTHQKPLAERDMQLAQIEETIQAKKKLLLEKKKDLGKRHEMNTYLSGVHEDYTKYHKHILREKEQQHGALKLLNEYIGDLISTERLVNNQLRTAKHDQKDILQEIDNVKRELDELIEK